MKSAVTSLFFAALVAADTKLFWGGTIVAFDSSSESLRVVRDGSLLVKDDRITGIFDSVPDVPEGTEKINVTGQIVTPGFIDTHRHAWQTAFKTLGSNTTLNEYVFRYGEYASAGLIRPKDIYYGQLTGLYESLNAGVTTILDHAHHTWSDETAEAGLDASVDSQARVFWGYTFHNVPAVDFPYSAQIANFRKLAEKPLKGPTQIAIAFDGWGDGTDEKVVEQIAGLAVEFNVSAITVHSVLGPYGFLNSPSDVHRRNMLNTSIPVVFSHGSFIPVSEVQLLRSTNQYISITPESEMHYGHTHEESFYDMDQAALGVDTHFTYSADMLMQARLWLQRVRYRYYNTLTSQWLSPATSPMSVSQAFKLATRAGGLALRRPDLGVIEVGAKADLVVWNANESPNLIGWRDPVAAVILHANVGDVLHVTVDGKFVKKNGKLTVPKYEENRREFLVTAERIQSEWRNMPYPVIEGPARSGLEQVPSRQVDSQRGDGTGYGELFV